MTFARRKQLVLATWIAVVAVGGLILAVDKPDFWMLIAILALAPAAIANWLWNPPDATLSQLIAAQRQGRDGRG